MRVLVVGAGIAGPTVAYWLARAGHTVTIVERAPRLREGGYLVDFWGAGFDVANEMGIVPELLERGYRPQEMREVTSDGRVIVSLDPRRMIDDAAGGAAGRYVTVARSDLAAAIFGASAGKVETIFNDTVDVIHNSDEHVDVTLQRGGTRRFDLVIGADGLHSRTRRLAFGPDALYKHDLGLVVAAINVADYQPHEALVAVADTEVGYQALRFAQRDGMTMIVFILRHEGATPEDDPRAQHALLRDKLANAGGEIPAMLDAMSRADTFYFDQASQIRMNSWHKGRVLLLGDAAACPSLLAGQGSALAMVEAYEFASALQRAQDDCSVAFDDYQRRLVPLIRQKQKGAIGLGSVFAPRNRAQLLLRNTVMRTMTLRPVSKLVMRRSLRDPITLSPATIA